MLRICRADAVDLAEALNYTGAAEWRQRKLERRIIELIQLNEDDGLVIEEDRVADEDERKRLTELLSKILSSDGEITITKEREEVVDNSDEIKDDDTVFDGEENTDKDDDMDDDFDKDDDDDDDKEVVEDKPDSKPKKKKKELSDTDKKIAAALATVKRLKDQAKEEKRLVKERAKSERDSKKKRANTGPEIDGNLFGISSLRNRLFCAGAILKEAGLGEGITEELVQKVNEAIGGEPKDKASATQLGWAWHAVNGYLNG